ncbi:phosphopantetheine-binding protein [Chitinispirillales bacterium ANBcel5]|uniref:acyl carrier protein n=1 Tax=Cellulosispirillum alkaliphilum TaxID=3039283 RepID=UPI002A58304A|nr:phosphopantetheine-binding protein [Chitinispirillales bacterium ANBcel5]
MDLREKVVGIVKKEIGVDLSSIDPEKSFREQVDIDSMKFVELYAALVDDLQIEIPPDILTADTLDQMFSMIEKAPK